MMRIMAEVGLGGRVLSLPAVDLLYEDSSSLV